MTKFIAIVSGKGGAGKTTATLNLGQALTDLGKKVIVVDTNFATPNVAIQLGFMNPEGTINKFLRKEKEKKKKKKKKINLIELLYDFFGLVRGAAPGGGGKEVKKVLKNSDEALI